MTAADLAQDAAVVPLPSAPGWYTATLSDAWSFVTPSGGVLMSVALRAMRHALAEPELFPVSATALFCSPVPSGPLEVRVEILRKGSAAAQLRAALSSTALPGPGLEVSATFAREREGPDVVDVEMPPHTPPEKAPHIEENKRWRFFDNVENRLAFGQPWWKDDFAPGPARLGRWLRYHVPQKDEAGRVDPFALPPILDLMPAGLRQKLGPNPRFHAPSLDLTVHFLDHTREDWFLADIHVERTRAGHGTASVRLFDRTGRFVARGTQMMILRRWQP